MSLPLPALRRIVAMSLSVPEVEIGCGDCGARLDRFAEMRLRGLDPAAALPLVEAHLRQCHECEEEFEGLMDVLRASEQDGMPWWRRFRAFRRRR